MSAAPELFEPGEYLDQRGPGYFSIFAKPNGKAKQESFELRFLPQVVSGLNPRIDTWISQAVFDRPNRRAVNLRSVGLLFADLDTYHRPGLADKTPEEQTALLLAFCGQESIPGPSIVLYSGRGLQAKWLLDNAIEPVSLYEWNQAQLALVQVLEPFAADMASKDVSRVLRVDRTVNTKSGETVRILHITRGSDLYPARYSFENLRTVLLKLYPTAVPKTRQARIESRPDTMLALPRAMNLRRLNWYRLRDLQRLWELRGGVREGFRELTLFWSLCFLLHAEPGRVEDLWAESEALAHRIDPEHVFYTPSDLSTLYRRAKAMKAGEMVEFQGRTYPTLYTPQNQTLIEIFKISPTEEREMLTIISQAEKNRRRVEKRRAEGIISRSEYIAKSKESAKPWDLYGISRGTYYRYIEIMPDILVDKSGLILGN
jgi:hypothetical protein